MSNLASYLGPFNVSMLDKDLVVDLYRGIRAVEEMLLMATKSEYEPLTEPARYLSKAGGKRFRPALALLSAQYGDPNALGVVQAAAAVELTHLATLHHDDVMDEADLRRGTPSANARWGNTVAILTGDYLFTKASQIVAELGPEAVMLQARTYERLVSGQVRETFGPRAGEDPLQHYMEVVAGKTGSLIAAAAQFGAMMSGADDDTAHTLADFAEQIGIAFQLADDVLDVTSDSVESGKTPGTDLREGVPTLPVLKVLAAARPEDERLVELLTGDLTDDTLHAEALALLRAHPAIELARADCTEHAERARALLSPLPDNTATQALGVLCDLAVDRVA